MMRRTGLAVLAGLQLMALAAPADAAPELGPFDQALYQYTQDGALDSQEYAWLRKLGTQNLPEPDRALARHFLGFAAKHASYIRMTYSYYRSNRQITLSFAFSPTYSEDSFLEAATSRDLLGLISQNDLLAETEADGERCGAAALLSAHYLLYGNFDVAFARLNIHPQTLTYRTMHLAQEALYRQVNTDGKAGLVSMFRYTQYSDGRVDNPVPDGEILAAAKLMRLRVHPLIGLNKQRFHDRKQVVQNFWRLYPAATMLVGVHLNDKTGQVSPPSPQAPQNHFVLIFNQNNRIWLLNSGVLDNGNRSALKALSPNQVQAMLYQTTGSIDALTRD